MNGAKRDSSCHVLFLSHGGGPLPLLGDPGHVEIGATLQKISAAIEKPSAIIVISAHWEEEQPTITQAAQPALLYDYYGFPEESYEITYPAPGNPALASKVYSVLQVHDLKPKLDATRKFDHGLFVPLKILYPQADIPCIQVSLIKTLDPLTHIQIGNALRDLEQDNLLVIGSGFSFHNMKAFFTPPTAETQAMNTAFEQWLIDTCTDTTLDEKQRTTRLIDWQAAPSARYCHPREEHLLPLHVCYGIAQRPCHEIYELTILGRKASMYLW